MIIHIRVAILATVFLWSVLPSTLFAGSYTIKGISVDMSLEQVLGEAVAGRGGFCPIVEKGEADIGETRHYYCWFSKGADMSDQMTSDLKIKSVVIGDELLFAEAFFSCQYTSTCGMRPYEVAKALRDAGVISDAHPFYVDKIGLDQSSVSIFHSSESVKGFLYINEDDKYHNWPLSLRVSEDELHRPSFD